MNSRLRQNGIINCTSSPQNAKKKNKAKVEIKIRAKPRKQ